MASLPIFSCDTLAYQHAEHTSICSCPYIARCGIYLSLYITYSHRLLATHYMVVECYLDVTWGFSCCGAARSHFNNHHVPNHQARLDPYNPGHWCYAIKWTHIRVPECWKYFTKFIDQIVSNHTIRLKGRSNIFSRGQPYHVKQYGSVPLGFPI